MADIHRLYPRVRSEQKITDRNQAARDLITECLANMRTVVFVDLGISAVHPGVLASMGELCKPEVTDFHIVNHILFGGEEEWRATPEFYAALVLAYDARKEIAAFFLPEQFAF